MNRNTILSIFNKLEVIDGKPYISTLNMAELMEISHGDLIKSIPKEILSSCKKGYKLTKNKNFSIYKINEDSFRDITQEWGHNTCKLAILEAFEYKMRTLELQKCIESVHLDSLDRPLSATDAHKISEHLILRGYSHFFLNELEK